LNLIKKENYSPTIATNSPFLISRLRLGREKVLFLLDFTSSRSVRDSCSFYLMEFFHLKETSFIEIAFSN
jgi:hypothetical protein